MTQEILLAATLTEGAFQACIAAWTAPSGQSSFMLLERQPREVITADKRRNLLLFESFDPHFDFTPYTSGRIFHEAGELRWERQQTMLNVVYTGDAQFQPAITQHSEVQIEPLDDYAEEKGKGTKEYLLFGKRLNKRERDLIGPAVRVGDFAELRIPRLLHYPLDEPSLPDRVQLLVREYVDPITGMNVAFRFEKLIPYMQKEQHA